MSDDTQPWPHTPPATNWHDFGLAEIARMFEGGDDARTRQHEQAWLRMNALCEHHARHLRTAAAQLAQRWPPEQSPASAFFLDRVLQLAANMEDVAQAAVRNAVAVTFITRAIAEARTQIAALRQAGQTAPPRYAPQVAARREQEFDERARAIMANADAGIIEAYEYLTPPWPTSHEVAMLADDAATSPTGPGPGLRHGSSPVTASSDNSHLTQPSRHLQAGYDPASAPVLDGQSRPALATAADAPSGQGATPPSSAAVGGPRVLTGTTGFVPAAPIPLPRRSTGAPPPATTPRPAPLEARARGPVAGGPAAVPPVSGVVGGRPAAAGTPTAAYATTARRRRRDSWRPSPHASPLLEPVPETTDHDPGPNIIGLSR